MAVKPVQQHILQRDVGQPRHLCQVVELFPHHHAAPDRPVQYRFVDDQVVVVLHVKATGRGSGLELERQDAMVFKLRDGMTVRIDYYNSKQQALKAVGLDA